MHRSSTIVFGALLMVSACSQGGDDGQSGEGAVPIPQSAYPGLHSALQPLTLTTPGRGGGERPVLAWEPVDDADHYMVVVLDPDGKPYWGWRTSDTKVRLGAGERAPNLPGPRLADGMSWSVVANNAQGMPVAISARRAIEP